MHEAEDTPVILYIDDSHGNLDAFERMLQRHVPAAEVYLASTAAEGLMIATQRNVDVVFVDLGLRAESDGLSLIRELKTGKRTDHIPVLLVTPPGTDDDAIEDAFDLGVEGWVKQLFEPLEVKSRIRTLVRLKRSEDRLRQAGLDEDKVLEEVLEAGGAAFIGAVDKSVDGLVVVGPDRRIRYVNQVAARIQGGDRKSLLGKPFELPLTEEPLSEVDITGDTGTVRKCEMRSQKITWEGESAWVVSLHDVTEATCMEEQLGQALKMEAVSQLAGSVAHDFKNIMHGILGFVDLMRLNLAEESEEWEYLREIERAAERGGVLTQQLQAFARRESLAVVDLDLNAMIEERLEKLRQIVGPAVSVRFHPTSSLPPVSADPNQLEQVLIHLCQNARDATPEGGSISITTGLVRFDEMERQEYTWASTGRYVTVSVDDTGVGMDLKTQSRIFEPFFTTRSKDGHTGLGLAIVYGVVTQHQGNIEVISTEDFGTEVTVYLPTSEKDLRRSTIPPSSDLPRDARTVLLAEDDNVVRFLTERILKRAGCKVYAAADGHEALALFEVHCDEIAIAVLDVAMPHLTGAEVYESLLAARPDLPVLFITGHGEQALHQRFNLEEQVEVLEKPFRPPTLLRKVRELLKRTKR